MIKLSELDLKLNILKDGKFEKLGYATDRETKDILVFIENEKFLTTVLENENVSSVICKEGMESLFNSKGYGVVISQSPKETFFRINEKIAEGNEKFTTRIGENCLIGKYTSIAKYNVIIGDNVTVEDFVKITEDCIIGDNSIIASNVTLGTQAFSTYGEDKILCKTCGSLEIGKNVTILENTRIEKGLLFGDKTHISDHVKVDGSTMISHDTYIGDRTLVCPSKIAGYVTIGKDCWVGFGAIISNRIRIGDKAKVSLGSVVTRNVNSEARVTGNFAIEHDKFITNLKNNG